MAEAIDEDIRAPVLGASQVRRLIVSILAAAQERLIRTGAMDPGLHVMARAKSLPGDAPNAAIDALSVSEADLGFDSLARIDLVMELARFFGYSETGIEDYFLLRRKIGDWVELTNWHLEKLGAAAAIHFQTSGSTGPAKTITHRFSALKSEVDAISAIIPPDRLANARFVSLIRCHHIYGFLWSLLLPQQVDGLVHDLSYGLPMSAIAQACSGDVILATPYHWSKMFEAGGCLPENVLGVSSGGPTTEQTWAAAKGLGLAEMIDIYGSSETAGVGFRTAADGTYRLCADLVRTPDGLQRAGHCPLEIQDNLDWTGAREFRVLGRKDPVVQVAGVNVNLAQVRDEILQSTSAKDAAVRLSGDRLKAFVAVQDGERGLVETQLLAWLGRVDGAVRPYHITYGEHLPRTSAGKLSDWELN